MLTKKDRQQLIADFKEVFPTKDDLKIELAKQNKEIIKGVSDYVHDNLLPYLAKQDKRIDDIEDHLGITTPS